MNAVAKIEDSPRKSLTEAMAERFEMHPQAFEQTLRATVFPANAPREEFAAFLLVAKQYNLNPVTKEIYAFPKRGGGIIPIVSIDGWMNLINSHPAFDGMEFEEAVDDAGELVSTTCRIYRKDRSHPISVTEWLSECYRSTEPWKMKHRMLRHKSAIQCARYAFGFAGVYDEDEAERFAASNASVAPRPTPIADQRRAPAPPKQIEAKPAEVVELHPSEAREPETIEATASETPQEQPQPDRRRAPPPSPARREEPRQAAPEPEKMDPIGIAMQRGYEARKQGLKRRAIPGEYREGRDEEAEAWETGWDQANDDLGNDPIERARQQGVEDRAAGRQMPKEIWDAGPEMREAWDGKQPIARESRGTTKAPFNPEQTRAAFKAALEKAACEEDVEDAWNKLIAPNESEITEPDLKAFDRMYRNRKGELG